MKVFIGMETSGVMRRAFQAAGHHVISCDLLPAQDDVSQIMGAKQTRPMICDSLHIVGDVFETLENLWPQWWPDLAVFHPDCTFFTVSAAWAFKDPDFNKYPGVGYHQKVKPGTLTGSDRRIRQRRDLRTLHAIQRLKIRRKIVENPIGQLSSLWMKPSQIVQPYQFGDDASKATCLWFLDENGDKIMTKIPIDPAKYVAPTPRPNGKSYWSNQTDTGQNRLSPSAERWQDRADTYPGIAAAIVNHFAK